MRDKRASIFWSYDCYRAFPRESDIDYNVVAIDLIQTTHRIFLGLYKFLLKSPPSMASNTEPSVWNWRLLPLTHDWREDFSKRLF